MATLSPNYTIQPRTSTETDRRYLLAESAAPSSAASTIEFNDNGDRTPRAHSPIQAAETETQSEQRRGTIADPSSEPRPYKGFPSEAHYLAALRDWAEEKKYTYNDPMLPGFYGATTMADVTSRPVPELGLKKKWKARKAKKEEQRAERRNTVA